MANKKGSEVDIRQLTTFRRPVRYGPKIPRFVIRNGDIVKVGDKSRKDGKK